MTSEPRKRLHPLLAAAAVSVIVFAGLGVAALTGWLPISRGSTAPAGSANAAAPAAAVAPAARAPQAAVRAAPAPEQRRVARASARPTARTRPIRLAEARPRCVNCGVIESVRLVEVKGRGTGLGAVAGGVAGALLGNQMGNGNGRTVMTLVGAAGGAFAGNAIEKKVRTVKHWDVAVRLADGHTRVLSYKSAPPWRAGDRVRLVNGGLLPN